MTKIADIIEPSVFLPYLTEKTAESSAFIQSGILGIDADFDQRVDDGGKQIEMPFWNDLDGEEENIEDDETATVGKIGTSQDSARKLFRQKAFGAHDLAGILAGDDPMMAIANLLADYRSRRLQAQVLAVLEGVFGAASMSGSVLSIHQTSGAATSANFLTGSTFIDACQLMGDAKSKLQAVAMHSLVESALLKMDLIDYIPDSEGKSMLKVFQGKRVIIDDGMPMETVDGKPVFTTYLFGQGALAYGVGKKNDVPEGATAGSTWQLEYGRTPLGSSSHLINRWASIVHPRGVKWTEASVAKTNATNLELAMAANWERVYEQKNIRLAKVTHNIPTT